MSSQTQRVLVTCAFSLLSWWTSAGEAGVIIHGTRVVYPAEQQEVVVRLENRGNRPALVQTWLDSGDRHSTPATVHTPISVSPPIFRIEPGQQQALRLRYTGEPLTEARERLFWLNVLEVPPRAVDAAQNNQIQLSFRTRLRVFLRPSALPYPVERAASKLQWTLVPHELGFALQVTNPTPYHVSLGPVMLLSAGKRFSKAPSQAADDSLLLPAGDVKRFVLPTLQQRPHGAAQVEFTSISDFGARVRHVAGLSHTSGG